MSIHSAAGSMLTEDEAEVFRRETGRYPSNVEPGTRRFSDPGYLDHLRIALEASRPMERCPITACASLRRRCGAFERVTGGTGKEHVVPPLEVKCACGRFDAPGGACPRWMRLDRRGDLVVEAGT